MISLTRSDFTYFPVITKTDGTSPVDVVHANSGEKFVVSLTLLSWKGTPHSHDAKTKVYFSDGREPLDIIVAKDVPFVLDVTSAVAGNLFLTVVDKTPGSDYFIKIPLQFS